MSESETKIQNLEREFVQRAGTAFAMARREALARGQKVLHVEGGSVIQVSPDGTRVKVKDIAVRKPAPDVRIIKIQ